MRTVFILYIQKNSEPNITSIKNKNIITATTDPHSVYASLVQKQAMTMCITANAIIHNKMYI